MIDFEPVRTPYWKFPMLNVAYIRQPGDKNHRWLTDREEHPLEGGISYTPSRLPGKVDRIMLACVEAEHLELGAVGFIAMAILMPLIQMSSFAG